MKSMHFGICMLLASVSGATASENRMPAPPVTQFTQDDILSVSPPGLVIEMPSDCPRQNDDPDFANYPLTISRNHGGGSCSRTKWSGLVMGDLWTNRCTTDACGHVKPNTILGTPTDPRKVDGQKGLQVRLLYSSIARANAATLAELDWWLGGKHWLAFTQESGIPASHVYTCIRHPCRNGLRAFMDDVKNGTIQMQGWSESGSPPWTFAAPVGDYVVMPVNQFARDPAKLQSYTVQLDYERADQISDTDTVVFLTQVDRLLQNTSALGPTELPHTYQLNIWGDELVPPTVRGYRGTNTWKSGLDAVSIPQIMALPGFRYYSILLWAGNRYHNIHTSWFQALGVVNGGPIPQQCSPLMQHVMMAFQLPHTSLEDAQTANNLLASWCVQVVEPWMNDARLGGPDCSGDQQLLWPAKWGALIGLPISCQRRAGFR